MPGQLAGRALFPVKIGTPTSFSSCHGFPSALLQPEPESSAVAEDVAGRPWVLARDQGGDIWGPPIGRKKEAGGEVGKTRGQPCWAQAGVFPRSTVCLQGHWQQTECAEMTDEKC